MSIHYYFAGSLFCHKDVIGNHLLAESICENSEGKYLAKLPQREENQLRPSPLEIRDNDYRMLLESQLALFNFDGPDLDSGTVAEFLAARFLDIPCVLLRTDFRSAGDQNADGEDWNLMCSGYPHTRVISAGAMELYQKHFRDGVATLSGLKSFYDELSGILIASFDDVMKEPSCFENREDAERTYRHFIRICGGTLPRQFDARRISSVISARGLFGTQRS